MLVIMAGLPGTGKSTLSAELARRLRGARIDKDFVRAALFAPEDIEYSDEQDDFCVDVMLLAAEYLLGKNPQRVVFLDGRTFTRRYQRKRVVAFAEQRGWPWVMLVCVCPEETARRRLEEPHVAANRNFALYQALQGRWEPIEQAHTTLDTDEPIAVTIERGMAAISAAALRSAI
jgi:predicted kinase